MVSFVAKSLVACTGTVLLCSTALPQASVEARSVSYELNIPAENLDAALQALALASHHKLLYRADLVAGKASKELIGTYTTEEAVTHLLEGTKLSFEITPASVVLIKSQTDTPITPSAQVSSDKNQTQNKEDSGKSSQEFRVAQLDQANAGPQAVSDQNSDRNKKDEGLTEIVVTGTHIHDAPSLVPIITMTHDDIVAQGYTRIDQALQSLPQNFSGGGAAQDSNGFVGGPGNVNHNVTLASGVNLRGLGTGATLVLLDGQRLPSTSYGDSVDISQIPLSIVDRIEVLPDGASAAYGSDAIAGVVNIITRKNYSGIDTTAWSNAIAAGKGPNPGASITGGVNWQTGNLVTSVNYDKADPLLASAREFTATAPYPTQLFPKQETVGIYTSLHQAISDALSFTSDVLASRRQFGTESYQPPFMTLLTSAGEAKQILTTAQLDYRFHNDWSAQLNGTFSEEKDPSNSAYVGLFGLPGTLQYKTYGGEARMDGPLLSLPAGAVRVAFGASMRRETFQDDEGVTDANGAPIDGTYTTYASARSTTAAYTEALIPIVSPQNGIPVVRQLTLDLAGRLDHYSDFGSTTNPALALRWELVDGFSMHAKVSRSFKAPTLYSLSPDAGDQIAVYDAPNPAAPTGSSVLLEVLGGNPQLTAERSKSFSVGFDYKPGVIPGFRAAASYFHIDYTDRIANLSDEGFGSNAIEEAAVLGSFVNLHPTLAQITQQLTLPRSQAPYFGSATGCMTASCIDAIAFLTYANVGSSTVGGIDSSIGYDHDMAGGRLAINVQTTYLLSFDNDITPTSPPYTFLNTVGNPLHLRARVNVAWTRNEFATYLRLNESGSNRNPLDQSCSPVGCPVSSWTTFDCGLSYTAAADANSYLNGLRIGLNVFNVFDRDPPFVRNVLNTSNGGSGFTQGLNFDPVNANALKRNIGISVSKRWGGPTGH